MRHPLKAEFDLRSGPTGSGGRVLELVDRVEIWRRWSTIAAMAAINSKMRASGLDQSHRLISKSKFLWGRQCQKLLWFAFNDPDRIGDKGSVIVYNAKIEMGVLDALADAFSEHAGWIEAVKPRIIDLLEPFQSFDYYHPEQHGSASIKAVLPVLTGRSYGDLEIQEGGQASLEFLRAHFGDVPEAERQKVRGQLERYCGQDTEGMIWIIDAMRRLAV